MTTSPNADVVAYEPFAETVLAFPTLASLQAWQPFSSGQHDGRLILLKGTAAPFDGGERWYRIDMSGTATGEGRIILAGGPAQAVPTELDDTAVPDGVLTFDEAPWDAGTTYDPGAAVVRGYNMFALGGSSPSTNQDPNSGAPWIFLTGQRGLPTGFSYELTAIENGNLYRLVIPKTIDITAITLLADAEGDLELDIQVADGAIPNSDDSIVATGTAPALASEELATLTDFTDYATTSLEHGHIMVVEVLDVDTITSATISFLGVIP